ncbi:MAG: ABC transporter ATPase, partial [Bacteroidetes bacterium]|nr:ABC transporter ATPase [Bacteroidota bacterium]
MKVEFDKIPDESRIWIYQSNLDFTESDVNVINSKSDLFVDNWMSHNKDLQASFKILNNRFLVIAVNEKFNP